MHRSLIRCTSCRSSVLEAFASLAGVSLPAQASASTPRLSRSQAQSARPFSHFAPLRQSLEQETDPYPSSEPPPSLPSTTTDSSIPWYLQIQDPTPPAPISPHLALQEIPPLPENPPTILSPILTHLSLQIGLDNLVLLDLRTLDPPPALGTNLLMIIGTARSVKHLNVSADRFCRWVRKDYKLRPFADGLLGRNELKLKLRRKARRMKLAQSVGNTVVNGADDGITTGWICVNLGAVAEVGEVDEHTTEMEEGLETDGDVMDAQAAEETDVKLRLRAQETPLEDEDEYSNPPDDAYVGFGSRTNSPRIVVQMFTEEKRAEMDLEGLWDFRNTKRVQKGEKANIQAEAAVMMLQAEEQLERDEEENGETGKGDEDNAERRKERDGETKIEEEIEQEIDDAEGEQEKPLGGIGAS